MGNVPYQTVTTHLFTLLPTLLLNDQPCKRSPITCPTAQGSYSDWILGYELNTCSAQGTPNSFTRRIVQKWIL